MIERVALFARSVGDWDVDREEQGHEPAVACGEKIGSIHQTLQDFATGYDVVVVDVAGNDSKEMRRGMTAAHTLVVVVRPSQLDLDTLGHMTEVINQVLDLTGIWMRVGRAHGTLAVARIGRTKLRLGLRFPPLQHVLSQRGRAFHLHNPTCVDAFGHVSEPLGSACRLPVR